ELLKHHGSCRHVDSECEGLCGEHHLDELAPEQLLDDLLERGQQPSVMCCDTALQAVQPVPVAQYGQVCIADRAAALLHDLPDLVTLVLVGEAHPCAKYLRHCLIASVAAEDEEDGGQQVAGAEDRDDFRATCPGHPWFPVAGGPAAPARLARPLTG